MKISFLVLAGGKGTRMKGADKSALPYDKERDFLEKILSEAGDFNEIIISKNTPISEEKLKCVEKKLNENIKAEEREENIKSEADYGFSKLNLSQTELSYETKKIGRRNYKVVQDYFKDCGPLSGLFSGMAVSNSPYLFVTTCDMPNITKDFIEYIKGYLSSDYDIIIVKDREGRTHPLCGIYKRELLEKVREQIEREDFKIMKLFEGLNVKILDFKHTDFDLDWILNNYNSPEDLKTLRKNPKVFAISGVKNSGKTTLIAKIVKEIRNRNQSVAVIKHDGHEFSPDMPGTDTWKLREAGASGTLIFSQSKFMLVRDENLSSLSDIYKSSKVFFHDTSANRNENPDYNIRKYLDYFKDFDYIILEGFKYSTYPKFEIVRKGNSDVIAGQRKNLLGVVTDLDYVSGEEGIEKFNLSDSNLPEKLLEVFETFNSQNR